MAGGKETPRQKMINMMYLVFIAMLALNMSKEVLSAFGTINESLEDTNTNFEEKNEDALEGLARKADESEEQFKEVFNSAQIVSAATSELYIYFAGVKEGMYKSVEDPKDYETMDKTAYTDELFVSGEKLTSAGKEFLANMIAYKDKMNQALVGNVKYDVFLSTINDKFSGDPVSPDAGVKGAKVNYVRHHFVGYPLISSITKITALQNDLKVVENEILSSMLSGQLTQIASMDNYSTLLEQSRSAYYQGNVFDGSIVLGRTDNTTVPNEVKLTLDGRPLVKGKDFTLEGGQVKLNVNAGSAGDHKIEGLLIFKQNGKDIEVPVDKSFSVIPKPNQAIVSADKMNVVYRGIENPITVSMPGVPENKVNASADGLRRIKGSQYMVKPTTGTELKINVTGEIEGEIIPSSAIFRIKSLPRPTPTVRGQIQEGAAIQMPKNALKISPIGATFENFDFDITPVVKQFTLSIPGQPSVVVNGSRMDSKAQGLLDLARAGDIIQIFDIKADVPGVNVKNMPAILVQLTN
ncbi:type IX secretion system protein PorM/GldM [Psychroflexus sp. MES1-P1E]|uniref:type IX secretion system motor protein PorM/GldM n=1 Tax=Psychroflexus sp. MES1-P1E TaxID=2058320 RepID=UPI000C7D1E21|nr:gliding motility protein GldM [Psychroflexus sp. MES1-P1E]PKG42159.1 gliding motility protein GldM [Psychroflexus sp. MES1-P1E]